MAAGDSPYSLPAAEQDVKLPMGQSHHGRMFYEHGKICHPEPLFFGGEGSPKTYS
jgi:hypothetical protein